MIELQYNSLIGSLPDTLGWLDHLTRLDVHGNELRTSRVCPLSCVRMQKCNVMSHPLLLQPTLSAVTKPTMDTAEPCDKADSVRSNVSEATATS